MTRLSRCTAVYLHGFLCSFPFPRIFLTASIFLEDSRVYFTPFRLFSFAPWDQRPDNLYMDSHPDAFHTVNESVVSAHECGEGRGHHQWNTSNMQTRIYCQQSGQFCRNNFSEESLSVASLFFFFFCINVPFFFFPPRFHTVFPLLALPYMVFLN